MHRKIQAFLVCAALSVVLASCNGQGPSGSKDDALSQETKDSNAAGQDHSAGRKKDSEGSVADMEPLLDPGATDEELLEVLKEETTVVADADYAAMLRSFQEDTNDHVGQIYQLEGAYVVEDGVPYLSRTAVDGEEREPCRIPLKYIMEEPEEGAWIRVTGILNLGEVGAKVVPLLEVAVLQLPDTPGQEEIPVS